MANNRVALCEHTGSTSNQRLDPTHSHTEVSEVYDDLGGHRLVLSLACARADDNRHADLSQHLPQEHDVQHPPKLPGHPQAHTISHC